MVFYDVFLLNVYFFVSPSSDDDGVYGYYDADEYGCCDVVYDDDDDDDGAGCVCYDG